jgi:hypothetical protein
MCLNFLFIGVDVVIAHSESDFFRWALIPIGYSVIAVLAVLGRLILKASIVAVRAFEAAMWLGVVVGVAGTFFHLTGNSGAGQVSVHRLLIEGSPIAAPIAFAGMARFTMVSNTCRGPVRRSRLLVLIGVGFLGAVAAAFLDHGRINFSPHTTFIPLVSGSLAALACFYMANREAAVSETRIFLWILAFAALTGLIGFVFHVLGDLDGAQGVVWARLLYRNPLLGPLLFCNLALLGGLSILPEEESMPSKGFAERKVPPVEILAPVKEPSRVSNVVG